MRSLFWKTWTGPFTLNKVCLIIIVSIFSGLAFLPRTGPCGSTTDTQLLSIQVCIIAIGAGMSFAILNSYSEHAVSTRKSLGKIGKLLVTTICGAILAYIVYNIFAALVLLPMMGLKAITIGPSIVAHWLMHPFGGLVTVTCERAHLDFQHIMIMEMLAMFLFNVAGVLLSRRGNSH